MMLYFACKIFGFKWGYKLYILIHKIIEYLWLIHVLWILLAYLYGSYSSVLFDGGSSSTTYDFTGRDVSVQELDSRPIHELDSRSRYELDSRPRYELDDGRTHF